MASPAVLHVVTDEKFIDSAFARFEHVAPHENRFVIAGKDGKLNYIKDTPVEFIDKTDLCNLVSSSQYKAIVFHSIHKKKWEIVRATNPQVKVAWIGFGFDYYSNLLSQYYPDGLLLPVTTKIMNECHPSSPEATRPKPRETMASRFRQMLGRAPKSLSALKHVDIFIPVLEDEYRMAKKANPWWRAKYIPWNYQWKIDSEDFLIEMPPRPTGKNILVGNSGDPRNNHAEVFRWVAGHLNTAERQVIAPVNYGGTEEYRRAVCDLGKQVFGNSFVPLHSWIPRQDYFKLTRTCAIGVFGHLRQQAAGNITQMLSQGSLVCLHSRSPLYQTMVNRGAKIVPWDRIDESSEPLERMLSSDEVATNIGAAHWHLEYPPEFSRTRALMDALIN